MSEKHEPLRDWKSIEIIVIVKIVLCSPTGHRGLRVEQSSNENEI